MILNFDYTRPDLNLPKVAINNNDFSKIDHVFLALPTFTVNDPTVSTEFQAGLKAGSLFQILNCKECELQNEDVLYYDSVNRDKYKIEDGRNGLILKFNYDLEYYQKLKNYSGQYLKVYLQDRNRNVYSINNTTNYLGIDTDLIDIQKLSFGSGITPVYTVMHILFSNGMMSLLDIQKANFSFRDVYYLNVTLTIIAGSSTDEVIISVVDSVYGCLVSGLTASDFSISDTVNTITVSSVTESSTGVYTLTGSDNFYQGTITVNTTNYNGTGTYNVSDAEFSPNDFNSDFKIS